MFAELDRLHEALHAYINANYHLSHPVMIQLRDELLRGSGSLQQRPFIESTPRYAGDKTYRELDWLPPAVQDLFVHLADSKIIFKSPYTHQAQALQQILLEHRDLVVTTGTGSGKTETFLLPVLGRLAQEAATSPESFHTRAVRALVLYPMNALVNDQLGRMRGLFGSRQVADWFCDRADRPLKFARYTGKTLYAGRRRQPGHKHGERLKQLRLYTSLEALAHSSDPGARREARDLIHALKRIGKWPSKPDSAPGAYDGMTRWYGKDGSNWSRRTLEDHEIDPELLIRHEVQASPPDVLITNYSMLEYTLLRPIERDIFRRTAEFFEANPGERFILVLDESHLYRGATGAEIGMLVRRLRSRLGLSAEQLQVISTSASFSSAERAREFVAGLSGKPIEGFEVLSGDKVVQAPDGPGDRAFAETLQQISLESVHSGTLAERFAALAPLRAGATLCPKPALVSCEGNEDFSALIRGLDATGQEREVKIEAVNGRGVSEELFVAIVDASLLEGRSGLSVDVGFVGEPALAVLGTSLQYPPGRDPLCRVLWDLLSERPVVGRMVNRTSGVAQDLELLPGLLFPEVEASLAKEATHRLLELCPMGRSREDDRPLLAARVHVFLRGLPGLWACTDPDCTELPEERRGTGPTGQIYAQPVRRCGCGARIFELFSCRSCGVAYLNAWTDDPDRPSYLWLDDIGQIEGQRQVEPLSILIPGPDAPDLVPGARSALLELTTGKLFLDHVPSAERRRDVWLPVPGDSWQDRGAERRGWFSSCPCCGAAGSRYPIQNHTTSGDDPFMEVVHEQLVIQPPRPDSGTPLRGRKVLVFSDGRQLASRLAGKLQESALRDSVRPLLLEGMRLLEHACGRQIPLSWAYLAVLVACTRHEIQPRPKQAFWIVEDLDRTKQLFDGGELRSGCWEEARELSDKLNGERGNIALMSVLLPVINDPYTGFAALGLADVAPIWRDSDRAALSKLPSPQVGIFASLSEDAARYALVQLWLQLMMDRRALILPTSPPEWRDGEDGPRVSSQKGSFKTPLKDLLSNKFHSDNLTQSNVVKREWLRFLYERFGHNETGQGFLLDPTRITLRTEGLLWGRCERCSAVQPLIPDTTRACFKRWGGKKTCSGPLAQIDPLQEPSSDAERIFRARKGMYRRPLERLRQHGEPPHPFSSEPHTAELNASGQGKAIGLAELYELRFQDIPVPDEDASGVRRPLPPIDVLSVTTTMEVGIDIGSLTAVAMRNVPPGRANYQQRAGRAGRRGSALSLVATWCGADSHDQEFFNRPAQMVSGEVPDPKLSIHNDKIIQRHLFAELISRFQLERVPDPEPDDNDSANVFESLGSLDGFQSGGTDAFSFQGLEAWLQHNQATLLARLEEILPAGFRDDPAERSAYLGDIPGSFLESLRRAGAGPVLAAPEEEQVSSPEDEARAELEQQISEWEAKLAVFGSDPALAAMVGEKIANIKHQLDDLAEAAGPDAVGAGEAARGPAENADPDADPDERKLLDRLFAQGILPRYAFPTSVVALHVFDNARSDRWNATLEHAPQRDLNQALSGYAPGREVWINGERHYSYAIWSPFFRDRAKAWRQRKLYFACETCGYAELREPKPAAPGDTADCSACGTKSGMGPAVWWLRPPGFAHPHWMKKALPSTGETVPTRPTSAKLSASFPLDEAAGTAGSITVWTDSKDLIVTNPGTSERGGRHGFLYCPWCGLSEPNTTGERAVLTSTHPIPNPDYRHGEQTCSRTPVTVTLGNRFRTDVAVLRFVPSGDVRLMPETAAFRVVLRTLSVALVRAAASKLDIEPSDIDAEYRVAMGEVDRDRGAAEIFLYDVAAGGAGFVHEAVSLVSEEAREEGCESGIEDLLQRTLEVLEDCPDKHCTSSCYQCLRSYKNKWYHGDLDRLLAASFLRHCWRGEQPELAESVEARLLSMLAIELRDAGDEDSDEIEVEEHDGHLWLPSLGRAVVISHPLCPDRPATHAGRQAMKARGAAATALVSQLVAERNLPLARQLALGHAAGQEAEDLPPGLVDDDDGIPVFDLEQLAESEPGEPRERVRIQSTKVGNITPDRYFLVQIPSTVADVHVRPGGWVLVRRDDGGAAQGKEDSLVLVRRDQPFQFTSARWSIGSLVEKAGGKRLYIQYHSRDRRARNETAATRSGLTYPGLTAIGEIRGILDPMGTLQPFTLKR